MSTMAKYVWPWLDIIWIHQSVRVETDRKDRNTGRQAISELLSSYECPEQLWCCMPNNVEAQILMSIFPRASLHLYEDGLGTYIDLHTPIRLLKHPNRLIKRSQTLLLQKQNWLRKIFGHLANQYPVRPITCLHLFLASELNLPSHLRYVTLSNISANAMLETIGALREALSIDNSNLPKANAEKRVLITGQYYYDGISRAWQQEFEMHVHVIQFYQHRGYEVWWREHPKAQRPFSNEFSASGICVQTFDVNSCHPIELYIEKNMFQKHASVSSTTLYTLKKLYGIESRTYIDLIDFHIPGTFKYVKKLLKEGISDYLID